MLYGVCLAAPAVRILPSSHHDNVSGYVALMVGYSVIVAGIPAWLANPLLLGAWLSNAFSSYSAGLTLALTSLVMALSFLILDTHGGMGISFERMLGYYLWVASILFAACAAAFAKASIRHEGASSLLHHPSG